GPGVWLLVAHDYVAAQKCTVQKQRRDRGESYLLNSDEPTSVTPDASGAVLLLDTTTVRRTFVTSPSKLFRLGNSSVFYDIQYTGIIGWDTITDEADAQEIGNNGAPGRLLRAVIPVGTYVYVGMLTAPSGMSAPSSDDTCATFSVADKQTVASAPE